MLKEKRVELAVPKLREALERHYWNRLGQKGPSKQAELRPFIDLVEYVVKAWKAGLDKTEQCALAGSKLLDSVLGMTNRRFASDVEEANDLYLAGMNVAGHLWDELGKTGGYTSAFETRVDEIIASLQRETITVTLQ